MFIRRNKNTVIETYISQSFELFRSKIILLHKKQYKDEDIKGVSCAQYDILIIYMVILYVALIYNDVTTTNNSDWNFYNEKYNLESFRKCVACLGIDIDLILNIFNLPYIDDEGVNYESIGNTFEVEPLTLIPTVYEQYDINECLSSLNYCKNYIETPKDEFYLETQVDNEFLNINNTQQLFLKL